VPLIQRRPTPEQAEHLLQAILATNRQLRDYHQRRAAGLCAYGCGTPSLTAYCTDCVPVRSLKQKLYRQRMVA
jgi:hypothetical protein